VEIVEWLSDWRLLKEDSAPWSLHLHRVTGEYGTAGHSTEFYRYFTLTANKENTSITGESIPLSPPPPLVLTLFP
jgi:hypothetical protein